MGKGGHIYLIDKFDKINMKLQNKNILQDQIKHFLKISNLFEK